VFHLCILANKQHNIEVTGYSDQHEICGGWVTMGKFAVGTLGVRHQLTQQYCLMFTVIYLPTLICGPDTDRVAV